MWHVLKTTLRSDESSVEYFGPFVTKEEMKDFEKRAFDPKEVKTEYIEMFEVEAGRVR